jgi:hypothetical protein
MKKQTAVEWYRLESQKLMIKAIRKEISNEEWRLLENKLGKKALAMEKEQIVDAAYEFMGTNFDPNKGRAELYYKGTYGGDK